MRAKSKQNQERLKASIVTPGEVLSDGTILELIQDDTCSRDLSLLLWNSRTSQIAPSIQHDGRVYVPSSVSASVLRAMHFPSRLVAASSTGELFGQLCQLFQLYLDLPETLRTLIALFVFASWCVDCLPTAVCLLLMGPATGQSRQLLRLLNCICRRPVMIGELTAAGLCSLPMDLCPTLLITQRELSPEVEALLRASIAREVFIPRNGELISLYGAKAISLLIPPQDEILATGSIHIAVPPAGRGLPVLDEKIEEELTARYQNLLLEWRLTHIPIVRNSSFDVPDFTSPLRDVARSLGACVADEPELQARIASLLRDQDEEVRLQRSMALESIVTESLLFFCHDGRRESVYVGEITSVSNTILNGRGEVVELKPREVGAILKRVGLFTCRLGSAGRGIFLLDAERRRIHELAWQLDVRAVQDSVERCPHCARRSHSGGNKS